MVSMCKRRLGHNQAFFQALDLVKDLEPLDKRLIQERYLYLCADFEYRCYFYSVVFHLCRTLMTVGSLIVPALLSIQYTDTTASSSPNTMSPEDFSYQIYWATWVISLLVTTSNGIFTLFKIDKKYFSLHTTLEQLRSEGWQYLELSGKYSGFFTPKEKVTHQNQFLFFCHVVEKIKMKQVQDEYYKLTEPTSNQEKAATTHEDHAVIPINNTVVKPSNIPPFLSDALIPPTPLNHNIQQLLQALTVDGGPTSKTTVQEGSTEVPVRSEVQPKSNGKEPLLRQASGILSEKESPNRLGTKVSTESVESGSAVAQNA
jgi:hypothetical protein